MHQGHVFIQLAFTIIYRNKQEDVRKKGMNRIRNVANFKLLTDYKLLRNVDSATVDCTVLVFQIGHSSLLRKFNFTLGNHWKESLLSAHVLMSLVIRWNEKNVRIQMLFKEVQRRQKEQGQIRLAIIFSLTSKRCSSMRDIGTQV